MGAPALGRSAFIVLSRAERVMHFCLWPGLLPYFGPGHTPLQLFVGAIRNAGIWAVLVPMLPWLRERAKPLFLVAVALVTMWEVYAATFGLSMPL